ncbi:Endonuclease G, mitochondrial [Eufriesea mexicana]|uniref:Endonuclease n=1 Tax=Eufriesea mexicana TaxID=516756 RepID=A0A310SPI8_9HYME|nr:Endonuclease G, mitochondrial [Eufriesea mexicana]
MKSSILRLSTMATIAASAWYVGKYSEQKQHLNVEKRDSGTIIFSNVNIKEMPGLPLFGTVSAAVPVESTKDMGSSLSSRVSEIMKYGFPGLDHVRSYEDFVLSYDRRNRVAHWVFEHLTQDKLQSSEKVSRSKSENSDYKNSGYDRGHLAAAGNHKCNQKHIEQTFFLTNMAPQVGTGFNRDSWNRLEIYVRHLTKVYKDVYVCTGPLYLPKIETNGKKYVRYEVIGANHVAVPTHFYKIVVGETHDSKLEMEAFVMPNTPIDDNAPLTNFQVPPESVERAAGLLFFDKISRDKLNKINGKKV